MSGLEKITSQILEEAKTSAAMKLETARKEADDILSKAKEACAAMEAEAAEKNVILKENYEGRIKSSAEQQRRTALLRAKQDMIAEVIEEAYVTLKQEDTESYFRTMEKILKTYVLAEPERFIFLLRILPGCRPILKREFLRRQKKRAEAWFFPKNRKPLRTDLFLSMGAWMKIVP